MVLVHLSSTRTSQTLVSICPVASLAIRVARIATVLIIINPFVLCTLDHTRAVQLEIRVATHAGRTSCLLVVARTSRAACCTKNALLHLKVPNANVFLSGHHNDILPIHLPRVINACCLEVIVTVDLSARIVLEEHSFPLLSDEQQVVTLLKVNY